MTAPSYFKGVRRIKKIISAIILMSMLCSCSSVSQNEPETSRALTVIEEATETAATTTTTEPITEAATTAPEIPPAPTTEPPTEPEVNELIFSDQGIEIYYQGVEQNIVKLCIINPSNELPVHAWMQYVSVNGIYLDTGCEGYAPNQGSNKWDGVIPLEKLQEHDISRINELKFSFLVYLGDLLIYNDKEEITITR